MNPLSDATVTGLVKHDNNTVEFIIELVDYPYLSDPNLLSACMNQYAYMYPNVKGWQAFIERGKVRIVVVGNVQWQNFKENING